MARILSISYNEALLKTRQRMLETLGQRVTPALGFTKALDLCKQDCFEQFKSARPDQFLRFVSARASGRGDQNPNVLVRACDATRRQTSVDAIPRRLGSGRSATLSSNR